MERRVKNFFYYIHLFAEGGGSTHMHHGIYMEVRRQLWAVGSLLPLCESQEWISGRRSWRQAPLPSGPSKEFLCIFGRDCWTPGPCNIALWVTGPGEAHLASRASAPHHVLLARTLAAPGCRNSTRGSTAAQLRSWRSFTLTKHFTPSFSNHPPALEFN